ncbi:MAG: DUF6364 family protein [Myxococcota bacterium]
MKQKLTVTVDEQLIPKAKRYARQKGISLSELIERRLAAVCGDSEKTSFSSRWRGQMKPKAVNNQDERYKRLANKHL